MTFDEKAKSWDLNPLMVKRAELLAKEIDFYFKGKTIQSVLEFGCGTGLLSYNLRNSFPKFMLMDTSQGMLTVLQERITNENLNNFFPILLDLNEVENISGLGKFDLIYTSMTMHHILDLDGILSKFFKLLRNKSWLCIADVVEEDGSFHEGQEFLGHNGFSKEGIQEMLQNNGFVLHSYKIFMNIEKSKLNGEMKEYPIFVLFAQKEI